jgi:predicted RNA binding protein YcfA (HicA-like mRNA interferase family)
MQPPTVREIIRRLESEGFKNVRTVGDHRRYVKGNRKVTVAGKPNEHLHPKT